MTRDTITNGKRSEVVPDKEIIILIKKKKSIRLYICRHHIAITNMN